MYRNKKYTYCLTIHTFIKDSQVTVYTIVMLYHLNSQAVFSCIIRFSTYLSSVQVPDASYGGQAVARNTVRTEMRIDYYTSDSSILYKLSSLISGQDQDIYLCSLHLHCTVWIRWVSFLLFMNLNNWILEKSF